METFGIIGMSFGIMGFVLATSAFSRISKLEKQLKETGVLEKEFKSE